MLGGCCTRTSRKESVYRSSYFFVSGSSPVCLLPLEADRGWIWQSSTKRRENWKASFGRRLKWNPLKWHVDVTFSLVGSWLNDQRIKVAKRRVYPTGRHYFISSSSPGRQKSIPNSRSLPFQQFRSDPFRSRCLCAFLMKKKGYHLSRSVKYNLLHSRQQSIALSRHQRKIKARERKEKGITIDY